MPFRQAHHVTGEIVALALRENKQLDELSLAEMQQVEASIDDDVFSVLGVQASVDSRVSLGGTAPANVKQAVNNARKKWL